MKKKVLLAAAISDRFKSLLIEKEYELCYYEGKEIDFKVQGIVTTTKLALSKELLLQFTNLKWIARLGSGIEIIDTAYCKENNIAFASSPVGIANAVAEHCVAMLISLQKNISSGFEEIKNKIWLREPNRGIELEGCTIGLIGYGHTGQAFAEKLSVFGADVIAYDKYKKNFTDEYVTEVNLSELQNRAEVISFHIPLTAQTKHFYDNDFIARCKPHIILNTSRGEIVQTSALLKGLENAFVSGAALDVLENERELHDKTSTVWIDIQKLLRYNVLLTPHIAGYSFNAIEKMSDELMEKLKDVI